MESTHRDKSGQSRHALQPCADSRVVGEAEASTFGLIGLVEIAASGILLEYQIVHGSNFALVYAFLPYAEPRRLETDEDYLARQLIHAQLISGV